MSLILQILQVLSGCLLIFLILMHSPKGGGMAMFGSAAESFTTHSSAEAGLNKFTYTVASVFLVISLILGTGLLDKIMKISH